jgi:hypothetical protein
MSDVQWASQIHSFYGTDPDRPGVPSMGPGVAAGGMVGGGDLGTSTGKSLDPRAGNLGSDSDISHIRGSNIG